MKLLRVGEKGRERPALLDENGVLRSLESVIDDVAGEALSTESLNRISKLHHASLPILDPDMRIGPCVGNVGKLVCVGLNYADHAAESNMQVPVEPLVFMKATSAICGPNDPVEIPIGSMKTDWEVELGVLIGTRAKYVREEDAFQHVAGYCVVNDYSEREFQLERVGQWVKGKSHDTFAPIGPWLVTKEEIPEPNNLPLWLDIDGERFQNGSTSTMVYKVAFLVSYLSQFMTLHPGDIISTGTPPGVGLGLKPPKYLKVGQTVSCGVAGLGEQKQRTISATA